MLIKKAIVSKRAVGQITFPDISKKQTMSISPEQLRTVVEHCEIAEYIPAGHEWHCGAVKSELYWICMMGKSFFVKIFFNPSKPLELEGYIDLNMKFYK